MSHHNTCQYCGHELQNGLCKNSQCRPAGPPGTPIKACPSPEQIAKAAAEKKAENLERLRKQRCNTGVKQKRDKRPRLKTRE